MKIKKLLTFLFVGIFGSLLALTGCNGKGGEDKTYNFVLTNATVPPVMATLDLLEDEGETYMWYGRKQTFIDSSKLGFNIMGANEEASTGVSSNMMTEMSNKVLDTYMKNKKAHFNLYVTDYGVKAAFKMFIENRIPESNWNVKLLEDGNGSYSNFNTLYGDEDGYTKFTQDKQALANDIALIKAGNAYDYTNDPNNYKDGYKLAFTFAATYENVEYMLQYPEYITSKSQDMKNHVSDINFKKANLTSMYKGLKTESQETFKSAVFDVAYVDPIIKQNEKKTLVVCGTSFHGEEFSTANAVKADAELLNGTKQQKFEKFFDKIKADFPDYNIVIKPHPSWGLGYEGTAYDKRGSGWNGDENHNFDGAYNRRVKYCEDKGIKVLPGQVPMEVLIWAYGDDIKIGGYDSTLYMNAEKDMTLFFIRSSSDINTLGHPLPSLINDGKLSDHIKVYYPNGDEVAVKDYDFTTVEA